MAPTPRAHRRGTATESSNPELTAEFTAAINAVDDAIRRVKVLPADREQAIARALADPAGFQAAVAAAKRVVDLEEHGSDADLIDALYNVRVAAQALEADQETRRILKRVGLTELMPDRPSANRDRDLRFTRVAADELGLPKAAARFHELARRADVVIGTPGRRRGLRKVTPDQVSRAYWKRAAAQKRRRPNQEDTAEDLGVEERTIRRMRKAGEITWPPAKPKTR